MFITAAIALKQISAEQEKVEGPILQNFFIGKTHSDKRTMSLGK